MLDCSLYIEGVEEGEPRWLQVLLHIGGTVMVFDLIR
jgi:hypothetical protein